MIEAAHNPEVASSNPAPATEKGPGTGAFLVRDGRWTRYGVEGCDPQSARWSKVGLLVTCWTPPPSAFCGREPIVEAMWAGLGDR